MLRQTEIPQFPYIPRHIEYNASPYHSFDYMTCAGCGEPTDPYLVIPVDNKVFCPECSLTKIDWCTKCGAPYMIKHKDKHKCKEEKHESGTGTNSETV